MAESIFYLTAAGVLLGLLPQFVSWVVATWGFRRGRWWPLVVSAPLAGLCFVVLAQGLYSPDSMTALQGAGKGTGRIVVEHVRPGALAHTATALILQVGRMIRGG